METICIRTKLEEDSLLKVREWFHNLNNRKEEVLQTLKNEGVFVESAFLERHDNEIYLIYYLKAENIDKAYEVFNNSSLSIDSYFKENWKKFCKGRVVLETLLDLDQIKLD